MARVTLCVLALVAAIGNGAEQKQQVTANPIRRVVTMLQSMEKQVTKEGEKETELYEKFMCYCKNGASDLVKSIADAEEKLGSLPKEIEAAESEVKQLKADIKQAQEDRAAAKKAMAEATALREKEAKVFADYKAEADANIGAATKAFKAIEAGMAGSFLQTQAAQVLRELVTSKNDISDYD